MVEDLRYSQGRKFEVRIVPDRDGQVRAYPTVLCPELAGEQRIAQPIENFKSAEDAKTVLSKRAQKRELEFLERILDLVRDMMRAELDPDNSVE